MPYIAPQDQLPDLHISLPDIGGLNSNFKNQKLAAFVSHEATSTIPTTPTPPTNHATTPTRQHQERIATNGYYSCDHFALVHTPVPPERVKNTPAAKEALDGEWQKLVNRHSWDVKKVRSNKVLKEEAIRDGKSVHFGSLMGMCHIKHSEKAPEFHKYKGRVVFRGDIVKDEHDYYAVFSEQGTSASHMAAAKFLDAIARLPGCIGEDSDAVGAYTQVPLASIPEATETWITLPRSQWPKEWKDLPYDDPVVQLQQNL